MIDPQELLTIPRCHGDSCPCLERANIFVRLESYGSSQVQLAIRSFDEHPFIWRWLGQQWHILTLRSLLLFLKATKWREAQEKTALFIIYNETSCADIHDFSHPCNCKHSLRAHVLQLVTVLSNAKSQLSVSSQESIENDLVTRISITTAILETSSFKVGETNRVTLIWIISRAFH